MKVLLWHDDVRLPPEGWSWARTNEAAQAILKADSVVEISLDHDLGLERFTVEQIKADPSLMNLKGTSPKNGLHLVEWMIANDLVPPKITIHSWNIDEAYRMAYLLNDAGHNVTISPYSPKGTVF